MSDILIPKVFHRFWDGPEEPQYIQDITQKWRDFHPGWEVRTWNLSNMPVLRNQDFVEDWQKVSPTSNRWQFTTNLLRLEILHDLGGVWIDADLEPLKNVEPLIEGCEAFTSRENRDFVNNGFTGCVPGHVFYAEMLKSVRQRVLQNPEWRSNRQCGPHLYTAVLNDLPPGTVRVLPTELIYPYAWGELDKFGEFDGDYGEAYTVHHWNNHRNKVGKRL